MQYDNHVISDVHHLFEVPLSPYPFVPDEGQSSSYMQSQAHPPSTQGNMPDNNILEEEEEEKEEDLGDEEYVVVHNEVNKVKGVASSSSSTKPTTSSPASTPLLGQFSGSQPGTHPHRISSYLSSPAQSTSRSSAPSWSSSSSSRQASTSQPFTCPASYPSVSTPAPTSQAANRPSFLSPLPTRQSTGRHPAHPVSLSQTKSKRKGASQAPQTHVANKDPRAKSNRTTQPHGYTDAHVEIRKAVNTHQHDASHLHSKPGAGDNPLDVLAHAQVLDAFGPPSRTGATHPAYSTNNPPGTSPPIPNPGQTSAAGSSVGSNLARFTDSKLRIHNHRMDMEAQKIKLLQTTIDTMQMILSGERPQKRPKIRLDARKLYDDEDEGEPVTEDEPESDRKQG